MKHAIVTTAALAMGALAGPAVAANCLEVTLTGVQGGPPVFRGQGGSGTLVTYGTEENNCRDVLMQFDAGRGTTQALSKVGVQVGQISAVFLTHMHSDHVEGLPDMMQLRWHFNSTGPKVPLICSEDTEADQGHVVSCAGFAEHIGDPMIESGEIAQRLSESDVRLPGGPADLIELATFADTDDPVEVWQSGDVTVSAIFSRHIAGHASFRVDTPAGSVLIGGDAGNDTPAPPRSSSTSEQVEALAQGAEVIVHSTIHPVMGPDGSTGFPPPIYYRQSTATDLGAMAARTGAAHLMLTHLIPPMGAPRQGPYPLPAPMTEADYSDAARDGGFEGNIVVGTDLAKLRIVGE
ncbi:MBL fold metallo-hydrolase [Anianabacter salinae]|uniref:MBL fold metallo-hydrolase n=1 Tax=Anianabacter salinae TaxID=2851023 RepID=UPI00225E3735|nr:MBL fold metallo-hydrolase [Anianabacter salinae]MBV0911090.1 MBL fold metallo-hydrolase [Anianabacter salinae]